MCGDKSAVGQKGIPAQYRNAINDAAHAYVEKARNRQTGGATNIPRDAAMPARAEQDDGCAASGVR